MKYSIKKIWTVLLSLILIMSSLTQVSVQAANGASITSFTVSKNTLDTFVNDQGKTPDVLAFNVQISVDQFALDKNYHVEVPFDGFTPNGQPQFENFTMTDPIFEYAGLNKVVGIEIINSEVVKYSENGANKSKLVITLGKFSTIGTFGLGFKLKINEDYYGNIPQNSILWNKPIVNLYDSDTRENLQSFYLNNSQTSTIKSSDVASISLNTSKTLPSGANATITDLKGEELRFNLSFRRRNRSYYNLKSGSDIKIFIEIPSSMEFTASTLQKPELSNYTIDTSIAGVKKYSFTLPQSHEIYLNGTSILNEDYLLSNLTLAFVGNTMPQLGTLIEINASIEYQFLNGPIKSTKDFVLQNSTNLKYRVAEKQNWNLYYTGEHYNNQVQTTSLVDTSVKSNLSLAYSYYGSFDSYTHNRGFRNDGLVSVKGVTHYIYQENTPGAKLDFGELNINFFRKNTSVPQHAFKVKMHIMNAVTHVERQHYVVQDGREVLYTEYATNGTNSMFTVIKNLFTLSPLAANEYISKVELIPYGSVDNPVEGELLPGHAFNIRYRARMWESLKWPDGSTPDPNKIYEVDVKSGSTFINEHPTLDYKDIKAPVANMSNVSYLKNNKKYETHGFENNTNTIYYAPSNTTGLDFNVTIPEYVVKDDDSNIIELKGKFIERITTKGWKDPIILLKVPKEVTITTKNVQLGLGNALPEKIINMDVTLLNKDANYKYYKIKGLGMISLDKSKSPIVTELNTLYLNFEVDPIALQGEGITYGVNEVWVGGSDYQTLFRKDSDIRNLYNFEEKSIMNSASGPLSTSKRNEYGLKGEDAKFNYSLTKISKGVKSEHNIFNVGPLGSLYNIPQTRASEQEPFTEKKYFGVTQDSNPQVKLEIQNRSNILAENVKLYSVLNYSNDPNAPQTQGSVTLHDINFPASARVYYSNELPTITDYYAVDISLWNEADMSSKGFSNSYTSSNFGGISNVKQIVVFFDPLSANETINGILTFDIPATGESLALNQFIYSFKQAITGSEIERRESETVVFSTDLYQLNYIDLSYQAENMPVPDYQTAQIPGNETLSMDVSNTIPTRYGYTFSGWKVNNDLSSTIYGYKVGQKQKVDFQGRSQKKIDLVAQWEPLASTLIFDGNTSIGSVPQQQSLNFAQSVQLQTPPDLSKEGYSFKEWNTLPSGLGDSYGPGSNFVKDTEESSVKLYAIWERNTYTVTFDTKDGTGIAPLSVKHGDTIEVSNMITSKVGYTFSHWVIKPTNDVFTPDVSSVVESITLEAIWSPKESLLTFDANGGDEHSLQAMQIQHGVMFEVPYITNELTNTGKEFKGWHTDKNARTPLINNEVSSSLRMLSLSSDGKPVTLYAIWDSKSFLIELHSNNGIDLTTQTLTTAKYGEEVTLPDASLFTAPSGKEFSGWSTLPVGGQVYSAGPNRFSTTATVIKLYAKWTAKAFTITFNGNGGTTTEPAIASHHGATITVPSNTLTARSNYSFVSWNTKADGSGTTYLPGSFEFTTDGVDVILYAQWLGNPHVITFVDGVSGETLFPDDIHNMRYDDAMPSGPANPTRTGYIFKGWSPALATTVTKDQTYVAQWEGNPHTITFTDGVSNELIFADDAHNVKYGDIMPSAPTVPPRTGYTFKGWSPTLGTTVTQDQIYVAQWEGDPHTVTYTDGASSEVIFGDIVHSVKYGDVTPLAPTVPPRIGYQFIGWSPSIKNEVDGSITYVAQWEGNPHTVTFTDGVSNELIFANGVHNVKYGDITPSAPTVPPRTGYTFKGWSPTLGTTVTQDQIYVAQWEGDPHTITFTDGVSSEIIFADEHHDVKFGDVMPSAPVNTTRTGYTFIGWSPSLGTIVTQDQTYVAQWEGIPHTVTFTDGVSNEQVFVDDIHTVKFGDMMPSARVNPTRTGYTFKGWSPTLGTTVTQDQIYEAQWEGNPHTITFTDGVSSEIIFVDAVHNLKFGDVMPSVPVNLTRSGYTFKGWSPTLGTTVTQDQTYVAQWEGNPHKITFTDGENNEVIFADEVHNVKYGDAMPSAPLNPTRTGYSFKGWSPTLGTTVTQDQTYEAQWEDNPHTVTFTDGVSSELLFADEVHNVKFGDVMPSAPVVPTRTGYTFIGWSPSLASTVTQDQTYEAQWSINKYKVSVNTEGGTPINTILKDHGSVVMESELTTQKSGHSMIEWRDQNGMLFEPGVTLILSDMTLVAQWKINQYTVTVRDTKDTIDQTLLIEYGEVIDSEHYNSIYGYTLDSWHLEADPDTQLSKLITVTKDMDIVLVFVPNVYTVIFDPNGGQGVMLNQMFTYDKPASLIQNQFRKIGYDFVGWKVESMKRSLFISFTSRVTEPIYEDTAEIMNLASHGNVRLIAQWQAKSYTLTFNLNGGSGNFDDLNLVYDETRKLSDDIPVLKGSSFLNWNTQADGLGITINPGQAIINLSSGDNVTLYAMWTPQGGAVVDIADSPLLPQTGVADNYYEFVLLATGLVFVLVAYLKKKKR